MIKINSCIRTYINTALQVVVEKSTRRATISQTVQEIYNKFSPADFIITIAVEQSSEFIDIIFTEK